MISLAEALYIAFRQQGFVKPYSEGCYNNVLIEDRFDLEEIADNLEDILLNNEVDS